MALFKTTEELAQYLPGINSVLSFDKIRPVIMDVQRSVLEPYCGEKLIQELDKAYNAPTFSKLDEMQEALLKEIQPALAPIAMTRYIPIGEVQIDGRGVTTYDEGDSRKGADNAQILRLRLSLLTMGMDALERLLTFLEKKVADYTDHQEVLKARPKSLLPNAREFSTAYQIFDSHLTYRGLMPLIVQNEDDRVAPVLGPALYTELQGNSNLSDAKKKLRRQAQRALAYCTVADAIELNMAVELNAEGLRLNYTSQIGNVKYYSPPDHATRESLLAAARSRAQSGLERLAEAVISLTSEPTTGSGLIDNTGLKIIGL
ncbi:DUF6712 family protein [Telluribacter humicola]|uniref:DUF6712 family protein n=1 Tax=Telluribacter humicola TaxID=1720261 RepID=UPI001A9618C3|nr:DUF6712 family protein [Telluribacter humicola]